MNGLDARLFTFAEDFMNFLFEMTKVLRIPGQVVGGPDEGVGGGVDAGQEQLRDVGDDFRVRQIFVKEEVG